MTSSPPASPALPRHGGDLAAAATRFGRPATGWLDLSTGINPFPYPLPAIPDETWRRLPGEETEAGLRAVAARSWNLAGPEQVAAAPGTQAIIQMLPLLRPYTEVAVIGPTYDEYALSFGQAGHGVRHCAGLEDIADAPVAVLCNPNNPDGRVHDPAELRAVAESLAPRGGLLVVDEAFADLAPEVSVAPYAGPGLLVLRSFGKFFGLAGLRLGFAIAEPTLAHLLRQAFGPWAVSGPALAIGRAALSDHGWIAATRMRLREEAVLLDAVLAEAGLAPIGGTSLFRLVNAPRAWALYEHLGASGILVRPFAAQPRWLRLGLPPDAAARDRLAQALAEWEG